MKYCNFIKQEVTLLWWGAIGVSVSLGHGYVNANAKLTGAFYCIWKGPGLVIAKRENMIGHWFSIIWIF